jgi:5-methylcytosine-specific restriction endonuclease McrA
MRAKAEGYFSEEEFKALGNVCKCCGLVESELVLLGRRLVPDHVIPLAKGGMNYISNIQPLCHGRGGCNNIKGAKHLDYRG